MFGQYDIGFLCELLFYARDHNGLHILKECSTLDSRSECRGNWQVTSAISYLCHLAWLATPDGAHAPELYKILSTTLTNITAALNAKKTSHMSPANISFWFELHLLNIQGLPPQLNRCTSCDIQISPTRKMQFSAINGGLICDVCAKSRNSNSLQQLSGDTLAILRRMQSTANFNELKSIHFNKIQQNQMKLILGAFLEYHIDLSPSCRSVAFRMFDTLVK